MSVPDGVGSLGEAVVPSLELHIQGLLKDMPYMCANAVELLSSQSLHEKIGELRSMESAVDLEAQGKLLDSAKAACYEMAKSLKTATSDLRKNINQREKQKLKDEEVRQKKLDEEKRHREAFIRLGLTDCACEDWIVMLSASKDVRSELSEPPEVAQQCRVLGFNI